VVGRFDQSTVANDGLVVSLLVSVLVDRLSMHVTASHSVVRLCSYEIVVRMMSSRVSQTVLLTLHCCKVEQLLGFGLTAVFLGLRQTPQPLVAKHNHHVCMMYSQQAQQNTGLRPQQRLHVRHTNPPDIASMPTSKVEACMLRLCNKKPLSTPTACNAQPRIMFATMCFADVSGSKYVQTSVCCRTA
jgi:hypothetical protein